jgi:hypothetical protein
MATIKYNDKLKQRYINAADSFAKKIKTERNIRSKINNHLRTISRDAFDAFARTGNTRSIREYRALIEQDIEQHFVNVAKIFSNTIRSSVGKPKNNTAVNLEVGNKILSSGEYRAYRSSHSIMDTTSKQIDNILFAVKKKAKEKGKDLTNEQVARISKRAFNMRVISRSNSIAITETQYAAESGKRIEFDKLFELDSEFADGTQMSDVKSKKMWIAVLDDHTREEHALADGQEVEINEPFIVGGEMLMYPGDDSMGASVANVIRCRCSSEIILE